MSCKAAGDDKRHARREIYSADGYCHSCHYARKRRRKAQGRISAVRRLYGWAEDEIAALRGVQRGRCAICLRKVGVVKNGSIDHDHERERRGYPKREQVRGILCSTCNRYLGHIGDNPVVGIRLAMYLIDPPAVKLLRALDKSRQVETDSEMSERDGDLTGTSVNQPGN